jgi:hypothetical protein
VNAIYQPVPVCKSRSVPIMAFQSKP